jgi:YtkA-like
MTDMTASHTVHRRLRPALGVLLLVVAATAAGFAGVTAMAQAVTPKPGEPTITLTTTPHPPVTGDNRFEVTATGPDGKPIVGAEVSVLLVMPAMPMMRMPEMRSTVVLKPAQGKSADEGKYDGRGQVAMAGTWNVTVSVKVKGQDVIEKKLTLNAR